MQNDQVLTVTVIWAFNDNLSAASGRLLSTFERSCAQQPLPHAGVEASSVNFSQQDKANSGPLTAAGRSSPKHLLIILFSKHLA